MPARRTASFPGAPIAPVGNPLLSGLGPSAYAERRDEPVLTLEGDPNIVPLRVTHGHYYLHRRDPDPRGMEVVGADDVVAGVVDEVWIDQGEPQVLYLEMTFAGDGRPRMVPFEYARICYPVWWPVRLFMLQKGTPYLEVKALRAEQFADVPPIKHPDQITLLEEERIRAYFAGGFLYADPSRSEPLL